MSQGFVVWLTGLSGAGKSTLAQRLRQELISAGRNVEILDGDEVRKNLSAGLGFSKEDRDTNVRRLGYVASLIARSGGVAIVAAISPYRAVRDEVRGSIPRFVEVYVRCSIGELSRRDVKGLYAKALAGEIPQFTGVSDPYEEPLHPHVTVDSERQTIEQSFDAVFRALERLGLVSHEVRERLPQGGELDALRAEAAHLPQLDVAAGAWADSYMLGAGALSPLTGFMDRSDYDAVLTEGRLSGGHPFTIPVALRVDKAEARRLRSAINGTTRITLRHAGEPVAIVDVTEFFETDSVREARAIYGTEDPAHPGVRRLQAEGGHAVAGSVISLSQPSSGFPEHDLTPREVRARMAELGWRTMVGFQTRNPVHRAHEYLQKVALETVDGLLLHPLVGETKSDDIPADVRMACYRELLEQYFPKERTMLATNPAWMRYAGPKEAVFHAIVRRNYGCTHFIVGRDHAGVGTYYDTYAAHRIFDEYDADELGIEILRMEHAFYCRECDGMASTRTCPHPAGPRATLSGTRVRELLAEGRPLPPEFSRPEVARLLAAADGARLP